MIKPAQVSDDAGRIRALEEYCILDTVEEPEFDDLARLASKICGTPIALVSLVDRERQWFKAHHGLAARETPRDVAFCAHAILHPEEIFEVVDSHADERFADNPLVTGGPQVRFYTGVPLVNPRGYALGTLCVIDHEPRKLSQDQLDALRTIARQVVSQMELRRRVGMQQQLQKTVIERSEMLDSIMNAAHFSIISTDTNGLILKFSKGAEDMLGYAAEEIESKETPAILHDPAEVAAATTDINREFGTTLEPGFRTFVYRADLGTADERQWTYIRKDGKKIQVVLSVTARHDDQGRISGYLGIARDITEKIQLQQAEARHADIIASSFDAILSKTLEGVITSWNPAAAALFGYPEAAAIGMQALYLIPPDRRHEEAQVLNTIREGKQIPSFDTERVKKDGSIVPVSVTVSPVRDRDGHIIGASSIIRDISARKDVERLKAQFISTVSHELRTPLTSISGALGLLVGGVAGELSAKAKNLVDLAHKNSGRLVTIINDILDIEKAQSGEMRFHPQQVSAAEICRRNLDIMAPYAEKYGVTYILDDRAGSAALIRVDPDRFSQVLVNLFSNAAKFSPSGASVAVRLDTDQSGLQISVFDQGKGVGKDFKERLFERFAQEDGADTRQKGGTGLGLHISKIMIEKMGGQIGYRPNEPAGSVFYVSIPYEIRADSSPTEPVADVRGCAERMILIVEDDPDVGQVLRVMLEREGCQTQIASNGHDALKLLQAGRFDALTLDIDLPGMNGVELVRRIRENPDWKGIPIIVVSASLTEEQKRAIHGLVSVIDFMPKPIDPDRLYAAIRNAGVAPKAGKAVVLHVEDDPSIIEIVDAILHEEAEIFHANSLAQARAMLAARPYDVILLDLTLPDGNGVDFIEFVQEKAPHVPIAVFSAADFDNTELTAEIKNQISAVLVKSKADNDQILQTVRKILQRRAAK